MSHDPQPDSGWTSTGRLVEVPPQINKVPEFNRAGGDHLWTMAVTYRVNPSTWSPQDSPILDQENLLQVLGPFCYYCEQRYTVRLAVRRCPGHPSEQRARSSGRRRT